MDNMDSRSQARLKERTDILLDHFAEIANDHGVSLAITSDKLLSRALLEFCATIAYASPDLQAEGGSPNLIKADEGTGLK